MVTMTISLPIDVIDIICRRRVEASEVEPEISMSKLVCDHIRAASKLPISEVITK